MDSINFLLRSGQRGLRSAGDLSSSGLALVAGSTVLGWMLLVRSLRYRRQRYHDSLCPGDLSRMSVATAQQIYLSLLKLEFPFSFGQGLTIGTIKTYGIPTLSGLLVQTNRITNPRTSDKRQADLLALIVGFTQQRYGTREWTEAMARLNSIHGYYLDQGRILMDDMRYTIGVSMIDAVRWVDAIEWRPLTKVERCANGVFWKGLGDAMGVTWDGLASTEWRDGIHFLEELAAWSDEYSATHMVRADSNVAVAEEATRSALGGIPAAFRPGAANFLAACMDEQIRKALDIPEPSPGMQAFVSRIWPVRRFLVHYFHLPRPSSMSVELAQGVNQPGRIHLLAYSRLPWYVKPTLWNRYGPPAWMSWWLGLPVPGDPKFMPQGFDPRTIGPPIGTKSQDAQEALLKQRMQVAGSCPFGKE